MIHTKKERMNWRWNFVEKGNHCIETKMFAGNGVSVCTGVTEGISCMSIVTYICEMCCKFKWNKIF